MKQAFTLFVLFLFTFSCQFKGSQTKESAPVDDTVAAQGISTPSALGRVYDAYLALSSAFVATDYDACQQALSPLLDNIEALSADFFKEEAKQQFWAEKQPLWRNVVQDIMNQKDIEAQRVHFKALSMVAIETIETLGTEGAVLYKSFCPMALNNAGAFWIANTEDINNPYFGDKMLKCGRVEQTYNP